MLHTLFTILHTILLMDGDGALIFLRGIQGY